MSEIDEEETGITCPHCPMRFLPTDISHGRLVGDYVDHLLDSHNIDLNRMVKRYNEWDKKRDDTTH